METTQKKEAPATLSPADHLKDWLTAQDREKLISIHALEEVAGIPRSTLGFFLKGTRNLPLQHLPAITKVLEQLGYTPPKA